jgi:hypothetical protein
MTADLVTETPARPRPRTGRLRRAAAPALVLALVGGAAACAKDAGDTVTQTKIGEDDGQAPEPSEFAATAAYLSDVAESSAAEPYRIEMDFSIDAAGEHVDADNMMTGEIDGEQAAFHMDMGSLFASIPGGPDPSEMTMDMVTDGQLIYIKAPMFAALADLASSAGGGGIDTGSLGDLAAVADQWGSVDPAAIGDGTDVGEIVGEVGAQGADPRQFLQLVSEATDPHELGDDVIKSTRVQGIGATITFQEMLEAQGTDVGEYIDQVTSGEGLPPGAVDALLQMEMPVEVWVDADDHVREVKLQYDLGELLASAGVDDSEMGSASFAMTMDFFDYSADDIAIEIPEATVDLTEAYGELLAAG